jgi:hypothetical protein
MMRTEQQGEVHHSTEPPVYQEQEVEEGFSCSACEMYVSRNHEAGGTKCAECHQWFNFCETCMPVAASRFADAEWLCLGCRQPADRTA